MQISYALLTIAAAVAALAIHAMQVFGTRLERCSTFMKAFTSVWMLLTGGANEHVRSILASYPEYGTFFILIVFLVVSCAVTPLILMILNDAFAVRADQLTSLKDMYRRRGQAVRELKKQQRAQRLRRAGLEAHAC